MSLRETKSARRVTMGMATSPAATRSREVALAKGELLQRCGWRFKRVTCLVAPDLDSVWCLWGESLRLPLACIREVSIAKVETQEFRVESFVDGTFVFRVPAGRPGALHYWVATLQGLLAHATEPGFSAQYASVWMATRVQARFRGLLGRRKAARQAAGRNRSERSRSPALAQLPAFGSPADDKAARDATRELLRAHRRAAADQLAAVRRGVLARRRTHAMRAEAAAARQVEAAAAKRARGQYMARYFERAERGGGSQRSERDAAPYRRAAALNAPSSAVRQQRAARGGQGWYPAGPAGGATPALPTPQSPARARTGTGPRQHGAERRQYDAEQRLAQRIADTAAEGGDDGASPATRITIITCR